MQAKAKRTRRLHLRQPTIGVNLTFKKYPVNHYFGQDYRIKQEVQDFNLLKVSASNN